MKNKIINIVIILIGNLLTAFGISTLILENKMISGGVTGVGIIFNHYLNLNISNVLGIP